MRSEPLGSRIPPRHKSDEGMAARARSRLSRWWQVNRSALTGDTLVRQKDPDRRHGRRRADSEAGNGHGKSDRDRDFPDTGTNTQGLALRN